MNMYFRGNMGNWKSGRKPWYTFENEFEDLTGQKFGRWTVLERAENNIYKQMVWKCICDCGWFRNVLGAKLKDGSSQSCGCLHAENLSIRMKQKWAEGGWDHLCKDANKKRSKNN